MKTSCSSLTIILLLLLTGGTAISGVVAFHQTATVTGSQVYLEDIARIASSEEKERIGRIRVASSPGPGELKELDAASIIASLRNNPKVQEVTWQGSQTIQVRRPGIRISKAQLQQIMAAYLQENLAKLPQGEIRLTAFRSPAEITLPYGELSWKVNPSRPDIISSSSFSILFSIDGKLARNCTVRGKLEAMAAVATATATIRKGERIGSAMIKMVKQNIAELDRPFLAPEQVLGMEAKRTLSSGRVIEHNHVQAPAIVQEGELVKISAAKGTLRISTNGIAKASGRAGEMIRVRNMSSNKLLYCRVDGPGQVSVEF